MSSAISEMIIPAVIFLIILYAISKRVSIFDTFVEGAKDGLKTSIKILPSLVGLLAAVTMLRASGFFDAVQGLIMPITDFLGFPKELVPLAAIRPISGSASLATVRDILQNFGPDSFVGRRASVMMGSTETTFYTLAVYLGSVGITNSRYTVKAALLADLTGIVVSVVFVKLLLN